MYPTYLNSILIAMCISLPAVAQNTNPFESIGKKGKILTLSNGQYEELFDQDSIQQIGTTLVNIRQMKVVQLLNDGQKAVLDNSVANRFLSIDPLTGVYPMLTPYQFASNRPIDGIDLDGKEWTKMETYDPATGVTHVKFQVKLKVVNDSEVFTDLNALKAEVTKQFAEAFRDVQKKQNNVSYSASIELETADQMGDNAFGVLIFDAPKPEPGFVPIAGMTGAADTKVNVFSVTGSKYNQDTRVIKGAAEVAQDIVHELIHTAGVIHPQDDGNTAMDVDLEPSYKPDGSFKTYLVGDKASLDLILSNIMIYGQVPINGQRVKELQPDKMKRNKVSPDQAQIVSEQIEKDESKKKSN